MQHMGAYPGVPACQGYYMVYTCTIDIARCETCTSTYSVCAKWLYAFKEHCMILWTPFTLKDNYYYSSYIPANPSTHSQESAHVLEFQGFNIPYSRKYWRELNLAVEPKIAIARILADLNLAVQYGIDIRIYASKKFWWILIWRL